MTARIRHEVPRRKDPRRQNLPRPLIRTQREDVLRAVARIKHRGHTGVEEARECLNTFLTVWRRHLGIHLPRDVEPALEMDMNIHQPGNQVFALTVDTLTLQPVRQAAGGNGRYLVAFHRDGHVTLGSVDPVDQRDVLYIKVVSLGRSRCENQGRCCEELHLAPPEVLTTMPWVMTNPTSMTA